MDKIKQSRDEVKEREVSAVHERTTRELAQKITKSSYQFKKKAHEIQFNFNSEIEESIVSAKKELEKIEATGEQEEPVKKAAILLDEGLKALERRQKHIKVAERSEFGWATVEHYDSHPLAADSDDEKRLEKAEKEAERAANKRRKGTGATGEACLEVPYPALRPEKHQLLFRLLCYLRDQQGLQESRLLGCVFPVGSMATWLGLAPRKQRIL